MPTCTSCGTESEHVYIGAIHVECVNSACQNFNQEVHDKWMKTSKESDYYDYIHTHYNGTITDPED